jgi:hypothetical protein
MANDHTEFIGRKNTNTRYKPVSTTDRRIKTLNRPVPILEANLPPDDPAHKFITQPTNSKA